MICCHDQDIAEDLLQSVAIVIPVFVLGVVVFLVSGCTDFKQMIGIEATRPTSSPSNRARR